MNDKSRFSGQVALVTGGGGDIGLATASRLAREGATVALLDVDADKLAEAERCLGDTGATVTVYACDVTDAAAVEATVAAVVAQHGAIDLLFNNAGYQGAFKPLHDYPADDFERVIRINLVGAFNVFRSVSAHMVERGYGRVVNTASMAGVQGPPNMAAYSASKFGVVGLTLTGSKDLAPHGIRVNAISPAFMGPGYMWDRQVQLQAEAGSQYYSADPAEVARQMIDAVPMRRYGEIDEIPGVVAFLMSDDASYLTGVNLPISGGIV